MIENDLKLQITMRESPIYAENIEPENDEYILKEHPNSLLQRFTEKTLYYPPDSKQTIYTWTIYSA